MADQRSEGARAAGVKALRLQLADAHRRPLPAVAAAVTSWSGAAQRLVFTLVFKPIDAEFAAFVASRAVRPWPP